MIEKLKKLSLEKQLFISFFSLCALLLLLSLSITLTFNLSRQRQDIDRNLSSIASYIASMDQIVSMLEIGYPDDSTIKELDSLSDTFSDISVIAVYNTDGLRFYHTDRHETGETYLDGEEAAILAGSPPYITVGYGTYGSQRRAFHSIRNEAGDIAPHVPPDLRARRLVMGKRVDGVFELPRKDGVGESANKLFRPFDGARHALFAGR